MHPSIGKPLSYANQLPGSYKLSSNDSTHDITITNIVSTLYWLEISSTDEARGDTYYYEYYVLITYFVPIKSLYTPNPSTLEVETDNGVGAITYNKQAVLTIDSGLVIHSIASGKVSYSDNLLTVTSTKNRYYVTTYYYVTRQGRVYAFQGSKIIDGAPGGTLFFSAAHSVALYSELDTLSADIVEAYVTAAPPTVRTFGKGVTIDVVFTNGELYIRFELSNFFRLASSTRCETVDTAITIGDGILSYGKTSLVYNHVHILGEDNGYITFDKSSSKRTTVQPGSIVYYNHDTEEVFISLDRDLTKIVESLKAFPEHSGQPNAVSVSDTGIVSYYGIEILTLDNETKVESIPDDDVLLYKKGVLKILPLGGEAFFEEQNIYLLAYHNFESVGVSLGSFNPAIHTSGMLYIDSIGRAIYVNNKRTQYVIDSFLASLAS